MYSKPTRGSSLHTEAPELSTRFVSFFPLPTIVGDSAFALASGSTVIAAILGGVAGLPVFMTSGFPRSRPILLTLEILDPYALQVLAMLHCCGCLIAWNLGESRKSIRWKNACYSVLLLIALFGLYYIINDLVFKGSFGRARPPREIYANVGFIARHLNASVNEGAPSGFASRGVFLVLTACLAGFGRRQLGGWRRAFSDFRVIVAVQLLLMIGACIARVLTGTHFWFDILLGFSLSVFIYWILIFLLSTYTGRFRLEDLEQLSTLLVSTVVWFSIIGFFYSRDASRWAPAVAVIILAFLAVQIRAGTQISSSGRVRNRHKSL